MLAGLRGPVVAGFAQFLQNISVPAAESAGQEMRSPDLPEGFANWVGRAVKLSPGMVLICMRTICWGLPREPCIPSLSEVFRRMNT